MKKLEFHEMEKIEGGGISRACATSIAGAIVFGTGGVIAAASGPVGGIAFAMAANYFGWGMAAWSCSYG